MTPPEAQPWRGPQVTFGPFRLYLEQRILLRADTPVRLGSRAREILLALLERAGEVVKKSELMARVWQGRIIEEGALRVHIAALRKALGDGRDGRRYVENVTGYGYRFIAPVTRVASSPSAGDVAVTGLSGLIASLPARLATLVGRDEATVELSAKLLSERCVTVVGPGGIGKTTVAVSVAHALSREFADAIVFLDLTSVANPGLVPSTLASALRLAIPNDDLLPGVLAFLRGRRMLLVLDNCEHVIEVVAALAERIYSVAPEVHMLATSREPLRAQGEHVYALPPLRTPSEDIEVSAAEALTYPAVQLSWSALPLAAVNSS